MTNEEVLKAFEAYETVYVKFMAGNATADELNAAAEVADAAAEALEEVCDGGPVSVSR